jgi:hypothetical protein
MSGSIFTTWPLRIQSSTCIPQSDAAGQTTLCSQRTMFLEGIIVDGVSGRDALRYDVVLQHPAESVVLATIRSEPGS